MGTAVRLGSMSICALASLLACGPTESPVDLDAGSRETWTPDAAAGSSPDAGEVDAAVEAFDAGPADSGPGAPDAGPTAPRIGSFTATPPAVGVGQKSTLRWTVTGATSLSIDPGVGDVIGRDSVEVTPATTTTYRLAASNSAGTDSAQVTVTVSEAVLLTPSFTIEPGPEVEVGEPVYFSALSTSYTGEPTLLGRGRFEWDFGDGYTFKFGAPWAKASYSTNSLVHYFMKPGSFTVTLMVSIFDQWDSEGNPTAPAIAQGAVTKEIRVSGEAPLAGFELQHANFHARIAQYVVASIPTAQRGNQTGLRVSLRGPGEQRQVLLDKESDLAAEEHFLLDHRALAQGDYVLEAELLSNGQRIAGGMWREKLSKRYSGLPKVGIDENNAFLRDGVPYFSMGTFMTNTDLLDSYIPQGGLNMLHTEGWYEKHDIGTWTDYLTTAEQKGVVVIGPHRGDYGVNYGAGANRWRFNSNDERRAEYVRATASKGAVFAWSWADEPNLGGRAQKVYLPTLAGWEYATHREDPSHPAMGLFYGYDWSSHYGTAPTEYDYLGSAERFGGRKWQQDALAFDIYPLHYRLHASLNSADRGPYAAYLDAFDRMQAHNPFVPIVPIVQPCEEVAGDTKTPPPTEEQVYMEAWFNVVHGAKGIVWFAFFDRSTIRWAAMKRFSDEMLPLAPVVLGPPPSRAVSDDANAPLNRVDTLIREKDGTVYLFAVRVTEPEPIPDAKYLGVEPATLSVNFDIADLAGQKSAEVLHEGRTVTVSDGRLSDTFAKNAVHIYRIAP